MWRFSFSRVWVFWAFRYWACQKLLACLAIQFPYPQAQVDCFLLELNQSLCSQDISNTRYLTAGCSQGEATRLDLCARFAGTLVFLWPSVPTPWKLNQDVHVLTLKLFCFSALLPFLIWFSLLYHFKPLWAFISCYKLLACLAITFP